MPVSGALGDARDFRWTPAYAAGEGVPEPHGDDADEQMDRLDHPVVGTGQQPQLRDAERRDDQAPDEDDERKCAITRREKPEDGEHPQANDEQAAEHHVELHQRQRMARPEEYPEHQESYAEEADE